MENLGLLLIGFCLFFFVLILLPLVYQMWKSAKNMTTVLEELNKNLPHILQNLNKITTDISQSTSILSNEAEELVKLSTKIRKIVDFTAEVGKFAPLKCGRALMKGIQVFLDVFFNKVK